MLNRFQQVRGVNALAAFEIGLNRVASSKEADIAVLGNVAWQFEAFNSVLQMRAQEALLM